MKMRLLICLGLIALLVGLLLSGQPGSAWAGAVEKIGDAGSIDWVSRQLTATGIGVPTQKGVGPAQMRAMVRRAAIVVARRNLLEVVKGVHIDSTTRVQNFMVKDDTVESRVKGVLTGSMVEKVDINENGTATATVSIPLTGQLEAVLMKMVVQLPESPATQLPLREIDSRIQFLEKRVRALEEKVGGLQRASVSREQMLMMFRSFTQAWLEYLETGPVIVPAGLGTASPNTDLKREYEKQAALLGKITARLNKMSARLSALESDTGRRVAGKMPESVVPYTGLVIDARNTGFRPCLKPEIIGGRQVVYPGSYINKSAAVRTGYVRYYRSLTRAQRSSRAGSLPLTIKATGAQGGRRSLSITGDDYKALKKMALDGNGFLANCKVIIVF